MNQKLSTKKNEKGQGLVEYALLAAFVAVVVAGVLMAFGPQIKAMVINVVGATSDSDYALQDGVLIIKGISPSSTPAGPPAPTGSPIPTGSPAPTGSPIPTGSPTPIYSPTPIVTPTPTWSNCASENGFCSFSGTALVRYGANDSWATQTFTDGVYCTNAVFGDPISGVQKSCQFYQTGSSSPTATLAPTGSPTPTYPPTPTSMPTFTPPPTVTPTPTRKQCAKENKSCSFSGTKLVRYGAGTTWVYKTFTNGVDCTNAIFGDPISGVAKTCQIPQ